MRLVAYVLSVALISELILQSDSFLFLRPNPCGTNASVRLDAMVDAEDLLGLSPIQIKQLRKETNQRRARNTLKQIPFDDVDDENFPEMLQQLTEELSTEGLVEVRGISKQSRRHVHHIAETIEEEANDIQSTFLVTVKGHAAVFFSPTEAIPLRTTDKRNEWSKRDKAPRDNRGQIVK